MPGEEGLEVLADAMAEFLFGLWQLEQEQAKQRTAASAATSVEEPASTLEANDAGAQELNNEHYVDG
jgi:cytochrome oxidase assembly protein ShyY1